MNTDKRYFFVGCLVILALSSLAFFIKYKDFRNNHGITNIEATYHSLLTIKSLSSLPIKDTALLPTVNLSGENNKNIPWAAAVKTDNGNYVYTSFPSLGFAVPYFVLNYLNADLSLKNLFIFNSVLSTITTLVFFTALYASTIVTGNEIRKIIAAAAGCSVLIYSCESLVSSGLVYWPHAISQLTISIILLLFVIRSHNNKNIVDVLIFLAMLAFSMTEWTGYIFSALLFIYLSITKIEDWKRISLICIASSLLAIFIFSMQIEMILSMKDFLQASMERFSVRSASKGSIAALLKGYWISFGMYILFIIPGVFFLRDKRYRFLLVMCSIPMFENIVFMQHATEYTFDRWKLAFFIGASAYFSCLHGWD